MPSYLGHVLTDNRHGLLVNVKASTSEGTTERTVAAQMLADVATPNKRVTVGADKAYDTRGFVKACRDLHVTPHVAQSTKRVGGSAIDARTTRHAGYEVSQRKRKRIEQCFGWGKVIGRDAPGHGPRPGQGRPVDDADHGGLQPHALAHLGTGASAMRLGSDECAQVTPLGSRKTVLGTT